MTSLQRRCGGRRGGAYLPPTPTHTVLINGPFFCGDVCVCGGGVKKVHTKKMSTVKEYVLMGPPLPPARAAATPARLHVGRFAHTSPHQFAPLSLADWAQPVHVWRARPPNPLVLAPPAALVLSKTGDRLRAAARAGALARLYRERGSADTPSGRARMARTQALLLASQRTASAAAAAVRAAGGRRGTGASVLPPEMRREAWQGVLETGGGLQAAATAEAAAAAASGAPAQQQSLRPQHQQARWVLLVNDTTVHVPEGKAGVFRVLPVDDFFKMTPQQMFYTLSLDEADAELRARKSRAPDRHLMDKYRLAPELAAAVAKAVESSSSSAAPSASGQFDVRELADEYGGALEDLLLERSEKEEDDGTSSNGELDAEDSVAAPEEASDADEVALLDSVGGDEHALDALLEAAIEEDIREAADSNRKRLADAELAGGTTKRPRHDADGGGNGNGVAAAFTEEDVRIALNTLGRVKLTHLMRRFKAQIHTREQKEIFARYVRRLCHISVEGRHKYVEIRNKH